MGDRRKTGDREKERERERSEGRGREAVKKMRGGSVGRKTAERGRREKDAKKKGK